MRKPPRRHRPLIAFVDYPDVFEEFYPDDGVGQKQFATEWAGTANHALAALLQREVGDVIWYELCLSPEFEQAKHRVTGCTVKMVRSSWLHRCLWRLFWLPQPAWRWRGPVSAVRHRRVLFGGPLLDADIDAGEGSAGRLLRPGLRGSTTLICPGDEWIDSSLERALDLDLQLVGSYYMALRERDRFCWAMHACAPISTRSRQGGSMPAFRWWVIFTIGISRSRAWLG